MDVEAHRKHYLLSTSWRTRRACVIQSKCEDLRIGADSICFGVSPRLENKGDDVREKETVGF